MRSCLVLLVLAAVACGKGSDKTAKGSATPNGANGPNGTNGSGSPAGSAGSAAPVPTVGNVVIFVDDQQAGVINADQIATWPRVDTLVPVAARRLGKWQTVTVNGASPKP